MKDKIIDKVLSGRYFLTIIGGLVFLYVAINKMMPPEAVASILTAIFMSYFNRADRNGKEQ